MAQHLERIHPIKFDIGAEPRVPRWLDVEFDLDRLVHNFCFARGICVLPPWACGMAEIRAYLLSRVARLQEMHLTREQSAVHVSQVLVEMSRSGWTPRRFRDLYYTVRGKPPSIVMKILWAALLMMSAG